MTKTRYTFILSFDKNKSISNDRIWSYVNKNRWKHENEIVNIEII